MLGSAPYLSNIEHKEPSIASLELGLATTARDLVQSLQAVLEELPGAPLRQQQLTRSLGLGKNVASRLLMGARKQDPLAAVHALPGPEGIRQFLKAAARRGVQPVTVKVSEEALSRYESFAQREVGGVSELSAVIGSLLPEAREKFEATAKQGMYKSAALLRGVQVDTSLISFLIHPNRSDSSRCDMVMIGGYFGLHRLRPLTRVHFTAVRFEGLGEGAQHGNLLQRYCSPWPLPVEARHAGERIHYLLGETGIGPRSAIDMALRERYPAGVPSARREPGLHRAHLSATVELPSRLLVLDVLVPEGLWPEARPELRVYDTTINGMVDPTRPESEQARLDLDERVQSLGRGATTFRLREVPEYVDMLAAVSAEEGWSVDAFRGFRCRINYPFYGSQAAMLIDLPEA